MSIEAMKQALKALGEIEWSNNSQWQSDRAKVAITSLRQAIAEAEKQEPVAWRYKPVREDNPRWEYTTNHPLDMGDGYLRPSLVEYCKCIEPLFAKEKPKLMLEKFREMKDLLEDTSQPQRQPLSDEQIEAIANKYGVGGWICDFARAIEAAHGIKGEA